MMNTFDLLIITPEKTFFSGASESLILVTPEGELGVLAGHEPIIATLDPSALKFHTNGVWKEAAVGEGFAQVDLKNVRVFVDSAEWPEDIDESRAKKAEERALERLEGHMDNAAYARSKAAVDRARARLLVKKAFRKKAH